MLRKYSDNPETLNTPEVLRDCFSFMDLTTLHPEDTVDSVRGLMGKVSRLADEFPGVPLPASVCVFPNFASTVRSLRCSDRLHVTAVSGCFPASQSFLEVKVKECVMAAQAGADEIDIVLALNSFLAGDEKAAFNEIRTVREELDSVSAGLGRRIVLKVILETGVLATEEKIAAASFLAMEAGADFIKTSTGKVSVNATPGAARVMCECIRKYAADTGRKVGFKAAGGISDIQEALCYYSIVSSVLGEEWLCPELFRFGVSRLGNALLSGIKGETVNFF